MTAEITEIRWHGRAGQGLITAVELLARAALEEGVYFQAFPEFGAERTGAPMRAYSRFSSRPILLHCPIVHPDGVVLLDDSLLEIPSIFAGLKPAGFAVLNTALTPEQVRERINLRHCTIYTVDASGIARQTSGRDTPNVPMLGALLRAKELVKKAAVIRFVRERMSSRLAPEAVESNVRGLELAYQQVRFA